jgi:hypothetical protein
VVPAETAPSRVAEASLSRSAPATPVVGAGTWLEDERLVTVSRSTLAAPVVVDPAPLPRRLPSAPPAVFGALTTVVLDAESASTRALESVALPGAASRSEPATEPVEP